MKSQSARSVWQTIRPVFIGLCVGVIVSTLLLLLAALVFRSVEIPHSAAVPLALTAAGIGAFAAGLTTALVAHRRGLLLGALCGAILFLILLLAGLARATDIDPGYAALKAAVLTVAGAIGGVLGVAKRR